MLKKLKKKFVIASVISISAVISILIGTINLLNYKGIMERADEILDFIMLNEGKFPDKSPGGSLPEDFTTPETLYESRFFTVSYDAEGKLSSVNISNIAAVDNDMAKKIADSVIKTDDDRGLWGNYRYLKDSNSEYTNIIFLDCSKSLYTFQNFFALSVSLSLFGIITVFFFLLIISGRILKPINESYEKQRRFIADAGHDIKTPLTIIDADAELLELEVGENEWLSDIKKQTERLTALTTELIYLSKMEGKRRAEFTFFPLSDVLEDISGSFSGPAKTKNISLNTEIAPGVYYKGDEAGIKKLITILFDNAVKYSPEHTEISVTLKRQKNGICMQVRNYAGELTDEAITHLFERFYRSDSARSSAGGFGIGLSVASAIVTTHKGKISAEKDGDYLIIEVIL